MAKKLILLVLVFSVCSVAVGAGKTRRTVLPGGLALASVDGILTPPDSNGTYFFKFDSDVKSGRGLIKPGTNIELLLSAGLEKLIENSKNNPKANYKLWGRVTKYNNRNFLFPTYFLSINQIKRPELGKPSENPKRPTAPSINDPNDELFIPEEVIARLQKRKIIRPAQLIKRADLEADAILADRTGFVSGTAGPNEAVWDKLSFTLDAVGRSVGQISFHLLPCQALERTLQKQSTELDNLRLKVSGIVTQYNGEYYLLLQRARRVHSHGNFGR